MGIDRIWPQKGNKRRAEQELIRIRSEFEIPLAAGELNSNMLFADYLDQWLETCQSENQARNIRLVSRDGPKARLARISAKRS